MKRRIFYKTRKLMLSTIREEDSEIEDEDTIKENECELKTDQIILKPLETARNIDNFQEKNSEKPENTIKTIKRSKAFISGLSSLGEPELLTDKKILPKFIIPKIYYPQNLVKTTYQNR